MNKYTPQPCDESWEGMRPTYGGRFCDRCERRITDLRQVSDEDLRALMIMSKGRLCGRLNKEQLFRVLDERTMALRQATPAWKKAAAAIATLAAVVSPLAAQTGGEPNPQTNAQHGLSDQQAADAGLQVPDTPAEDPVMRFRVTGREEKSEGHFEDVTLERVRVTLLRPDSQDTLYSFILHAKNGLFEVPIDPAIELPDPVWVLVDNPDDAKMIAASHMLYREQWSLEQHLFLDNEDDLSIEPFMGIYVPDDEDW